MIYARKSQTEWGEYVDYAAVRWNVTFAENPYTPSRWELFESESAALEAWGLTYDPASPLQGFGVASPLPEPEGEQG